MQNSTIAGNSSIGDGGGIALFGGEITLENVVITRNTAAGKGGGLFATVGGLHPHDPSVALQNTYIVLNTAAVDGGDTDLVAVSVDDGTHVTGNLPDNCAKASVCP